MDTVSFTEMAHGTRAEYEFLALKEEEYVQALPERIMHALERLSASISGYKVTRLEHSLQGATRAHRAGEDEELVVAVLVHDIGDDLAPYTHSELAASILRPFVSEQTYWVVKHHGLFQTYYYAHHYGEDRHARDRLKDHPYYEPTVAFCEKYDQNCFDPDYDTLPLSFFEPMVRRLFSRAPTMKDGTGIPLT